ncbi:MAG: S26 family signal peptidase [Dermatophilaceae bacterium]
MSARRQAEPTAATPAGRGSRHNRVLLLVAVAVVLAASIQAFVVQTYVVPSAALSPTVEPGERLVVWKMRSAPEPGDLVVLDTTDAVDAEPTTPIDDGPVGRVLTTTAGWLGVDIGARSRLGVVTEAATERVTVRAPDERAVDSRDVVGTAVWRLWPLDRCGRVRSVGGVR